MLQRAVVESVPLEGCLRENGQPLTVAPCTPFSRPIEVLLVDDSAADVRLTQEAFKEWACLQSPQRRDGWSCGPRFLAP